jgi:hypothetical protein
LAQTIKKIFSEESLGNFFKILSILNSDSLIFSTIKLIFVLIKILRKKLNARKFKKKFFSKKKKLKAK